MEFTAKSIGVSRDWNSGKFHLTLEVNEDSVITEQYDSIKDLEKLSVKVTKYSPKRGRDANAYYWVLVGKLARKIGTSSFELHNQMLARCALFARDSNNELIPHCMKEDYEYLKNETLHLFPTDKTWKTENGKVFRWFFELKGSSQMSRAEFSKLLDEVVEEAKAQGIQTDTPRQIGRMKALWQTSGKVS